MNVLTAIRQIWQQRERAFDEFMMISAQVWQIEWPHGTNS